MINRLYNNTAAKEKRRTLRKNATDAERKGWSILRRDQMGVRFFRQYSVGPYVLDFFCPIRRLAVEIDGGQHNEAKHKQHDVNRTAYLTQHHIQVLRFWNNEVLQNIEGVWQKIKGELDRNPSQPPLILRGGDCLQYQNKDKNILEYKKSNTGSPR